MCLLRVGDLKVNVSSGRMSLRTAMIVVVKCRRSESKCFFRSYVFADCGHEDKRRSKSNIVDDPPVLTPDQHLHTLEALQGTRQRALSTRNRQILM